MLNHLKMGRISNERANANINKASKDTRPHYSSELNRKKGTGSSQQSMDEYSLPNNNKSAMEQQQKQQMMSVTQRNSVKPSQASRGNVVEKRNSSQGSEILKGGLQLHEVAKTTQRRMRSAK